jgi:hypothetical protein
MDILETPSVWKPLAAMLRPAPGRGMVTSMFSTVNGRPRRSS